MHIEKALDVTKCEKPVLPYGNIGDIKETEYGNIRTLASCDLFTAKILNLNGETTIYNDKSFVSLLLLDGDAEITYEIHKITAKKGDSIFIPANLKADIKGTATILESFV